MSPDEPGRAEGAHAPEILWCVDEAKLVVDQLWNSLEGALSGAGEDTGNNAYCLAISTPAGPTGRFYEIHSRKAGFENWYCRHVKLDEVIAAGRISQEWVDEKKRQWGDSSLYKQKVEGIFCSDDEDGLICYEWIMKAIERGEELMVYQE